MSMTIAAMKGKLGDTDYFIFAMKAKQLAALTITGGENERRKINYARVKTEIAPYLAKDKERFFGAVIMTAKNYKPDMFEPLSDFTAKTLPKLYQEEAKSMGFLTFTGGEVFIPIDGQHRISAIQFALNGKDEKREPIPNMPPCPDLADEEITVILVPYNAEKTRKISDTVNCYAKPLRVAKHLIEQNELSEKAD